MRRLLIKELRSAWWVIALAYVTVLALVLVGDPLAFRGDSDSYGWLIVPFLVLGLRAYSGELGANTVEFLYSRPIKWWQILLAKLIVGIIAIVSTALLGLLLYMLTAPRYYMPFLHEEVLNGLLEMMGILGVAFVLGFAVSAMMPGIALSFIALVGIGVAFGVVLTVLEWIGRALLISSPQDAAIGVLYSAGAGLIASILIIRKLPKLGVTQRLVVLTRWLTVGLAFGLILAAFGIPGEHATESYPASLSPDGRWALYGKNLYESNSRYGLADMRAGELRLIIPTDGRGTLKWSPDSGKVALMSEHEQLSVITTGPKPLCWEVEPLPEAQSSTMQWSPDSRFLVVLRTVGDFASSKDGYFIVDTARKTIRPFKPKRFSRYEDVITQPGDAPVLVKWRLFWPPRGIKPQVVE